VDAADTANRIETGRVRLGLGGNEQGEQRENDDAGDHGGVISSGGLKAERQQARGAGSLRQGHGGPGPGNLGHDGGIDDGGLIASDRRRHSRVAVAGDKTEGEDCAGKQETKDDCFRGFHEGGFLFDAEDTRTRGRTVNR
jgi:hypothetical protein